MNPCHGFVDSVSPLVIQISPALKDSNQEPKSDPHETSAGSASSNPSAETAVVEKQVQYYAGLSNDLQEDPMIIEAATAEIMRIQSPGRKRSKAAVTEPPGSIPHRSAAKDITSIAPLKRQYLTQSKAATIPCMELQRQSKAPATAF